MGAYPLIGITTSDRNEQRRFSLAAAYVDAIRRAGGMPVMLPPGETHLAQLLKRLDGIIMSGGGDVDPALYGGSQHEAIYMIEPERDRSEIELTQQLVKMELPMLNICRGVQVLNVALGGTLIEHLPDEVGEDITHRAIPPGATRHEVKIEPDSRLAEIIGQTEVMIASWHHQALRQAAPHLRVVARAADGTIEAVEMPDHPWLIGVQWHPELTAIDDPAQQRLFDDLVEAAGRMMNNER
jgi:putative glutamine amidotransferase